MILLILVILIQFAIPVIILIYVYKLDNPKCGCIKDWRNTFIKIWTIIAIGLSYVLALTKSPSLGLVLAVMNVVNVYALFTYVGDLNTQNCKCATENLEYINDFLYYWRFIMVVSVVVSLGLSVWRVFNPNAKMLKINDLQTNYSEKTYTHINTKSKSKSKSK